MSDIDLDNFVIESKLGEGGQGKVFLVPDANNLKFVIKEIDYENNERKRELAMREIAILQKLTPPKSILSHRNLINFLGYKIRDNSVFILMEYVAGVINLFDGVNGDVGNMNLVEKLEIMLQLAEVLKYAHERNVVHGDIKLENILLKDKTPYLIDFGFSCIEFTDDCSSAGTLGYIPPEVLLKNQRVNKKSDIFSLGVVFYVLLFLKYPYDIDSIDEYKKFNLIKYDSGNLFINILLRNMLSINPDRRPNIDNIILTLDIQFKQGKVLTEAKRKMKEENRKLKEEMRIMKEEMRIMKEKLEEEKRKMINGN